MERLPAGWRSIDEAPEEDDFAVDPSGSVALDHPDPMREDGRASRPGDPRATGGLAALLVQHHAALTLGGIVLAILAAAALFLGAGTPQATVIIAGQGIGADGHAPAATGDAPTAGPRSAQPSPIGTAGSDDRSRASASPDVVVDVGGAVARPGVYALPGGSRLADALRAAGGFSLAVDVDAAGQQLNLASPLGDGTKIRVPARGDRLAGAVSGTGSAPGSVTTPAPVASAPGGVAPAGGLVDINHATEAELDALPGIGPVTAAKIIAARAQQPFASVQELDDRNVVGPSVLARIQDLVTVRP